MGMRGRLALSAVVGIAVIGTVSANAGSGKSVGGQSGGGSGSGGNHSASGSSVKNSSPSAQRESGGGKDTGRTDKATEKRVTFSGDGDFQVGSDIKPGTYRSTGNSDGMCYWERAKNASGEMDSVLTNDNVTGTSYVTVKATDKVFKSSDCADWETVAPGAKGTPAGEMAGDGGMFKVGTDIAPGTYESTGNTDDSCYWERERDAEHSLDSIVANDNANGTAVVTISASDAYFKTSGCEGWKRSA